MPQAKNVAVLRAVYAEAWRRVQQGDIPSILAAGPSGVQSSINAIGHQQQQARMTHALRPTARLIGG
jgi:hypothetical protein